MTGRFPLSFVISLALATSLSATPAFGQHTVPPDYIEVRSPLFGAVISYPPDWELRPPYNGPRGYTLFQVFAPEGEEGSFTGDRPHFSVEVSESRGAMRCPAPAEL